MTTKPSQVDALLEHVLELPDYEWSAALDEACSKHPTLAAPLRQRFSYLQRLGLATDHQPGLIMAPGERFGSYVVRELVGAGGMGVVYRARRDDLNRDVALKVLRPEFVAQQNARSRFEREADALARVAHDAICTLYDYGEHDGLPYLAMRFVRGETLAAAIARASRSAQITDLLTADVCGSTAGTIRAIVSLFVHLASGLDEAHQQGMVHRDIKPENVVLEHGSTAVLIDFGLARHADTTKLTRTGEPLGTPAYMAPEQVLGGPADVRTDIYALAATFYECLTLRPPFEMAGREALYRAILHDAVPDARRHNPDVSRDLAVVLQKALQKDPAHRFASMREFGDDLGRVVDGEPVRARATPLLRRITAAVRRSPLRAGAVAVGSIVLANLWVLQAVGYQRSRAVSESIAASTTALMARDPTVSALLAAQAWRKTPDSLITRSNLVRAMTRNLQTDEWQIGGRAGGFHPSPDGAVAFALSTGVWLRDNRGLRRIDDLVGREHEFNAGAWARDGDSFLVGGSSGLLRFARDGSALPLGETTFTSSMIPRPTHRAMPVIDATVDGYFVAGDLHGHVSILDGNGRQIESHEVGAALILVRAFADTPDWLAVDVRGRAWVWEHAETPPRRVYDCGTTAWSADTSSDRRWLAVSDDSGSVHVLRVDGGAPPIELRISSQQGFADTVALAPDGSSLLAGFGRQRWAMWRLLGPPEQILQLREKAMVRRADFSPSGRFVALGDQAGQVAVYDRLGRARLRFAAHQDQISELRFTGETQLATGATDGQIREWRLDVPGLPVLEVHDHAVFSVGWLPDGQHLVSTGGDGKACLSHVVNGKVYTASVSDENSDSFVPGSIAPDGRTLATFGTQGVRLWRVDSENERLAGAGAGLEACGAEFAWRGSEQLLTGGTGGELQLRNATDGSEILHTCFPTTADFEGVECWSVAASRDGTRFAAAMVNGVVGLWRADGTWLGFAVRDRIAVLSVDFAPEDRGLLVGFADGRLELRDLERGGDGPATVSFEGARGSIREAVFSPDGQFVAAVSSDRVLHVWDLRGEPWLRIPQPGLPHDLSFSPDGRRLAVACSDGTIRIWPVTRQRMTELAGHVFRELTPEERRIYLVGK